MSGYLAKQKKADLKKIWNFQESGNYPAPVKERWFCVTNKRFIRDEVWTLGCDETWRGSD